MKSFLLQLTDELLCAIQAARGDRSRAAAIEDWLWAHPAIRAAAKRIGVQRKPRPERGKYQRHGTAAGKRATSARHR